MQQDLWHLMANGRQGAHVTSTFEQVFHFILVKGSLGSGKLLILCPETLMLMSPSLDCIRFLKKKTAKYIVLKILQCRMFITIHFLRTRNGTCAKVRDSRISIRLSILRAVFNKVVKFCRFQSRMHSFNVCCHFTCDCQVIRYCHSPRL